ncbi:MAG: hypothetical protein HY806_09915 [Nitrospirae bacterium]|nr:hypothetical protein [Nitrospirota bacterium]
MQSLKINYKDEILREIDNLTSNKAKEVLEFICFIKHKKALEMIDPTQLYFYTPKWQEMEKKAEEDIRAGRVSEEYSASGMDKFFADIKKGRQKKSRK